MDGIEGKIRALRYSTAVRSFILTYGIAAFGFFTLRSSATATPVPGVGMFIAGLVIQIVVWVATKLVDRHISDAEHAAQTHFVIALVADGLTVLLFAIGTFRAIGAARIG